MAPYYQMLSKNRASATVLLGSTPGGDLDAPFTLNLASQRRPQPLGGIGASPSA